MGGEMEEGTGQQHSFCSSIVVMLDPTLDVAVATERDYAGQRLVLHIRPHSGEYLERHGTVPPGASNTAPFHTDDLPFGLTFDRASGVLSRKGKRLKLSKQ